MSALIRSLARLGEQFRRPEGREVGSEADAVARYRATMHLDLPDELQRRIAKVTTDGAPVLNHRQRA